MESLIQIQESNTSQATMFDIQGSPKINLRGYLESIDFTNLGISNYMNCSESCYIISLILLDRFQQNNPDFHITSSNIHKLAMVSIMVAVKSSEDTIYINKYYSKVFGLKINDLNNL